MMLNQKWKHTNSSPFYCDPDRAEPCGEISKGDCARLIIVSLPLNTRHLGLAVAGPTGV